MLRRIRKTSVGTSTRKDQESILPIVSSIGRLVTMDKAKTDIFNKSLPQSSLATALCTALK